jgi:predicted membrane metal-binding protein
MHEINGIQISIREPSPGDINFFLSTMLKGLYYGDSWFSEIDQEIFFSVYEPFVKNILINNYVKVACLEDDPDVIISYIVYRDTNIVFSFTKKSYRRLGIMKLLCPSGMKTVSHLTKQGNSIRKKLGLKFNPFIIG